MFQYCEVTMGILSIWKGISRVWYTADAPPRGGDAVLFQFLGGFHEGQIGVALFAGTAVDEEHFQLFVGGVAQTFLLFFFFCVLEKMNFFVLF